MHQLRRIEAGLIAPVILSALLRLFQLPRSSYWLDEMTSLDLVNQPGIRAAFSDNNPPLYHLILKLWVSAFGNGELATRSLSVAFSVIATIFVMRAVAQIRDHPRSVFLAGFFHAVCVLSLAYAQETRMYALFEMWMAISLFYFLRFYRSRESILGYSLTCVAMALTHYFAIVPISIELVFLLFSARNLSSRQKWALVGVVGALGLVQTYVYLHFFRWDGLQWQMLKSSAEPFALFPRELISQLSNRSWVGGGIVLLLFLAGVVELFTAVERERGQRMGLLALILLPVLLFSGVGLLTGRALLLPRYLIYLIPPFCVFLALVQFRRRWLEAAVAGAFAVGSCFGIRDYYLQRKEPWRDAASIVQRYPGSVVYTSRTVSLRTPYFTRIGVEVKKLRIGDSGELAELTADVAQGKKVWVLENFWGGYPYLEELKRVLTGMHFEVSELSLRDGNSPPILAIVVEGGKS